MFRKIIYALWVLMNIYLIVEWSKQIYQYYITGNTTGSIIRFIIIIGFTLLTGFIIYRDIRDHFNRKKNIPTYPNYCGLCKYQNKCPNKHAELRLLCGINECKYWEDDKNNKTIN